MLIMKSFVIVDEVNKRNEHTKAELKNRFVSEAAALFEQVYAPENGKDGEYVLAVEKSKKVGKDAKAIEQANTVGPRPTAYRDDLVAKASDEAVETAKEGAKVVKKVTR